MTASFGVRLDAQLTRWGRLCVGIDPHGALLQQWGLEADAGGILRFGMRVVEAAAGRCGIVKPQVAFFERFGSAGMAALEQVIAAARQAGLLVLADAKRGDIGSTMAGYAEAWLAPGAPLESDALTVNPYLGFGALAPAVHAAHQHGKGLFVLAATSNPEAAELQRSGSPSLAARLAAEAVRANAEERAATQVTSTGSIGLVLGATVELSDYGIDPAELQGTPILAPGFGAQGARVEQLGERFGAASGLVLVSQSRSILAAGPGGLEAAIDAERAALEAV